MIFNTSSCLPFCQVGLDTSRYVKYAFDTTLRLKKKDKIVMQHDREINPELLNFLGRKIFKLQLASLANKT